MPKYDLPNDYQTISSYNRLVYLVQKPNRSVDENTELASLQTQLKDYLITADDWNNISASTPFGTTSGSANAYTLSLSLPQTSYYDGMTIQTKIHADSTGASTLNVNGWGIKSLKMANGLDVTNLKKDSIYTWSLNISTGNFILQGDEGGSIDASASTTAVRDTSGYLYANTPAAGDNSLKLANTTFVSSAIEQSEYKIIKSNKDSNGVYTTVQYKRNDGTLAILSVLSGGSSPQYTTRTITYYAIDGATVKKTTTRNLSYDTDGSLLSEV